MSGSHVTERLEALLMFFSELRGIINMMDEYSKTLQKNIERLKTLLEEGLGGLDKEP